MIVAATLVAGCTSLDTYDAQYHVVRRGETLYQIAWEHGVDQRDLARWNGLRNPDLIQVGQRLRLTALPGAAAAAPAVSRAPAGGSAAPPAATAARPRQPAPQTTPPARPPVPPPAEPPPAWVWPTDGQVVSRFGSSQGIATWRRDRRPRRSGRQRGGGGTRRLCRQRPHRLRPARHHQAQRHLSFRLRTLEPCARCPGTGRGTRPANRGNGT